jgi:hypothetical protein
MQKVQLHAENNKRWRIEERNDWKLLIAALQGDRARLEEENARLQAEQMEGRVRVLRVDELEAELERLRVALAGTPLGASLLPRAVPVIEAMPASGGGGGGGGGGSGVAADDSLRGEFSSSGGCGGADLASLPAGEEPRAAAGAAAAASAAAGPARWAALERLLVEARAAEREARQALSRERTAHEAWRIQAETELQARADEIVRLRAGGGGGGGGGGGAGGGAGGGGARGKAGKPPILGFFRFCTPPDTGGEGRGIVQAL